MTASIKSTANLDSATLNDQLRTHTGIAVHMLFNNIDTDQIIPSKEMKKVSKRGLGEGLFAGQRYLPSKQNKRIANPDFILNVEPFNQATILLSCKNFGCGSSREHAAWALREFGFKIIIAESFGTIFRINCLRNGIVPITLEAQNIDHLYKQVIANPEANKIHVDVTKRIVIAPDSQQYEFELESHFQEMLVDGLDFISLTMKRAQEIAEFIERDKQNRPWAQL
ncbi:MAG: 3-isopropylmalate dehydratase small subunit [Acidiferrobacterales bacterium]|nr:3-isopropylmalate dehydratase small subunit [Acidiferrobacterales bacterium]